LRNKSRISTSFPRLYREAVYRLPPIRKLTSFDAPERCRSSEIFPLAQVVAPVQLGLLVSSYNPSFPQAAIFGSYSADLATDIVAILSIQRGMCAEPRRY
jgi:hypothetical protein